MAFLSLQVSDVAYVRTQLRRGDCGLAVDYLNSPRSSQISYLGNVGIKASKHALTVRRPCLCGAVFDSRNAIPSGPSIFQAAHLTENIKKSFYYTDHLSISCRHSCKACKSPLSGPTKIKHICVHTSIAAVSRAKPTSRRVTAISHLQPLMTQQISNRHCSSSFRISAVLIQHQ